MLRRSSREAPRSFAVVIASDSEAIQTKPRWQTQSLDCFASLAMTACFDQERFNANAILDRLGAEQWEEGR